MLKCDATGLTTYRILSGTSNGRCYVFDQDMPGVGCRQYNNGGATNGPCLDGSLMPRSALVKTDGPAVCKFYNDQGCGNSGSSIGPNARMCTYGTPAYLYWQSFKCSVSIFLFNESVIKSNAYTSVVVNSLALLLKYDFFVGQYYLYLVYTWSYH